VAFVLFPFAGLCCKCDKYVNVYSGFSRSVNAMSGIPLGSVLGPLLFLLYVNDIPNYITSTCCLCADDCILYRQILPLMHLLYRMIRQCLKMREEMENFVEYR